MYDRIRRLKGYRWQLVLLASLVGVVVCGDAVAAQLNKPVVARKVVVQDERPIVTRHRLLLTRNAEKLRETRERLELLSVRKLKVKLTQQNRTEWQRQNRWLKSAVRRLTELLQKQEQFMKSKGKAGSQQEHLAEMQNFQAEFLALQQALQSEARRYQTISNAARARHDGAMNSIRNMK